MVQSKIIVQNTIVMYIRMIIVLVLSLITVRVALQVLGQEDYGIYNVVAGFVSMLAIIGTSLRFSSNRFIAVALGKGDLAEVNRVFNLSLLFFTIIAVVFVIILETFGLWFISQKLVIPPERLSSAVTVYHFAAISFVLTIVGVPFSAMIISYENMSFIAIVGILESVGKLCIIYLVAVSDVDKLVFYAFLLLLVTFLKESSFIVYCLCKYKTSRIQFCRDWGLGKELFKFAGWCFLGTTANVANNQGHNILINLFFGPIVNSDRAVSFQVSNALSLFGSNVFTVLRPQMLKSYAKGQFEDTKKLFFIGSKLLFFLTIMLGVPLFVKITYVLDLWLVNYTHNMVVFTKLTLIYAIVFLQHEPITTLIHASGKLKKYSLIVETTCMLSLPITYVLFKMGLEAYFSFIMLIVTMSIAHIFRMLILRKTVPFFSIKEYLVRFCLPMMFLFVCVAAPVYALSLFLNDGFGNFVIICVVSVVIVIFFALLIGLSKSERVMAFGLIKSYFQRRNKR